MPESDITLNIGFDFNGVEILRSDFGHGLRDRIAFEIAYTASTTCTSKAGVLELFYAKADQILIMLTGPSSCIGCGCHDNDACWNDEKEESCHWLRINRALQVGVCASCPGEVARFDAGDFKKAKRRAKKKGK